MSTEETNKTYEELATTREEFIPKIQEPQEEDTPRLHHTCGNCLAFKTHFCPFWFRGNGEVTTRKTDHACSDWTKKPEPCRRQRFNWAEVVTNL